MRQLLLAAAVVLLAACQTTPPQEAIVVAQRPPFNCDLDPRCEAPCPESPTWQLRPDGTGDWDDLRLVAAHVARAKDICDEQRKACLACINRARAARAIQ